GGLFGNFVSIRRPKPLDLAPTVLAMVVEPRSTREPGLSKVVFPAIEERADFLADLFPPPRPAGGFIAAFFATEPLAPFTNRGPWARHENASAQPQDQSRATIAIRRYKSSIPTLCQQSCDMTYPPPPPIMSA